MTTLDELKQLDAFYCSLIDLVPVDNFGLDNDIKDQLRDYKHAKTDKKLKLNEKNRLSASTRQVLSRLDFDQPHTITDIWTWLSGQKSGASNELRATFDGHLRQAGADHKPQPLHKPAKLNNGDAGPEKASLAEKQSVKRKTKTKISTVNLANKLTALQARLETLRSQTEMGDGAKDKTAIKRHQTNLKRQMNRLKRLEKSTHQPAKRAKVDNNGLGIANGSSADDHNRKKKPNSHNDDSKVVIRNSQGQIVYSKFDFAVAGLAKDDKKVRQKEQHAGGGAEGRRTSERKRQFAGKDYKRMWDKVEHRDSRLAELKEKDPEKASRIENDMKWDKALDKTQGVRIKDDKTFLKTNMKRKETQKNKSKQQWHQREANVQGKMARQQEKRRENLKQRADDKRQHKIEKAIKKGRTVIH